MCWFVVTVLIVLRISLFDCCCGSFGFWFWVIVCCLLVVLCFELLLHIWYYCLFCFVGCYVGEFGVLTIDLFIMIYVVVGVYFVCLCLFVGYLLLLLLFLIAFIVIVFDVLGGRLLFVCCLLICLFSIWFTLCWWFVFIACELIWVLGWMFLGWLVWLVVDFVMFVFA